MLDLNLFQTDKGGDPELIRESQRKRGASVELVDEVIGLHDEWRKARFELDQINKKTNTIQKDITKKMKAKEDATELLAQKDTLNTEKDRVTVLVKEKEDILKAKASTVGNLVHESVPVSLDEANNEIIRKWEPTESVTGVEEERFHKAEKGDGILSHHEVLFRIDGYDSERGTSIAGHRGYFLTSDGVDLNMALIQYGLSFLRKRGYKKLQVPFFYAKRIYGKDCAVGTI